MIKKVRKRDGRLENFQPKKITIAINKAFQAVGTANWRLAEALTNQVVKILNDQWQNRIPSVENISDIVENVLIANNLAEVAKAFILYREKRREIRSTKEFFGVRDDLKLGINAIKILEKRYLLHDEKGQVKETPSQLFSRVAKAVALAEKEYKSSAFKTKEYENIFYQMMSNLEFLPNSPTLMNAGTSLGQLSACFVLPIEDSLDSIFETLKMTAKIHQSGGGTGFSFSRLRPKGDIVHSTGGVASGPISFIRVYDSMTEAIRQGGRRRGANMGVLRIDHPDIFDFITAKNQSDQFNNFNFSVALTDKFLKAVLKDQDFELINPRTQKAVRQVKARELFDLISASAWRTGDPGVIFIDEINRKNPTAFLGKIETTNPCGEVPLHPYESCNLGSINLTKIVVGKPLAGKIDWAKLKELVWNGVRFLDDIITINRFPNQEIAEATLANRRIGLGVMGFAELLILLGIPYSSEKALRLGRKLMSFIQREAWRASASLAEERGSFPNFAKSIWPKRGFKKIRNATLTTIAPTGSLSIIAGCSSGIEPLFAISFVRNVMEGMHLLETNQIFEKLAREKRIWSTDLLRTIAQTGSLKNVSGVPASWKKVFVTALEIDFPWHIRMQAAFQRFTDNAVSKTINLREDASIGQVRKAFLLAWKLKCKGLTVYRYGAKKDQVLTIGSLEKLVGEKHVIAQSEFSGGCLAESCLYL